MYDADLVRMLCRQIAAEQDRQKALELTFLLQAVLTENQEEVRQRVAILAKKYALTPGQPLNS